MAEEPETPAEDTPDTPAEDTPAPEAPAAAPVEETTSPDEPVPAEETPAAGEPAAEETPPAEEPAAAAETPAAEEPAADEPAAEETPPAEDAPAAEAPSAEASEQPPADVTAAAEGPGGDQPSEGPSQAEAAPSDATPGEADEAPRAKPEIPGADLEVDIVPEGYDPLNQGGDGEDGDPAATAAPDGADDTAVEDRPVAQATIDLGADARYRATGKRKTAIARVVLRPGSGAYTINGRELNTHFPRPTLQRNIRQPLEAVGYESRMDVVASLKGGGTSAQAGALRHGIARALIEADPNLRGELKRRGFLTRDPRKKERKKAGLKKARKRPQFSKR